MKFIKNNIVSILIVAVAVLLTLQISSMFRKGPSKPSDEVIKAKDETIRIIQEVRLNERAMYDSTISALLQRDNQKVIEYKTTQKIYEKIPVYIGGLGNDELKSAVENYR